MAERFTITYQYGYYHVSIPNYDGGEVVDADSFDALVAELRRLHAICGHQHTADVLAAVVGGVPK